MSLIVEAHFASKLFPGTSNQLAGFVDGQLAGVAFQLSLSGKELFYLTLMDVGDGPITFKLYNTDHHITYEVTSSLNYVPSGVTGSFLEPYVIDFAPFSIQTNPDGTWATTLINENWAGIQTVYFVATDCDYPDKSDTTAVVFTINFCENPPNAICKNDTLTLDNTGVGELLPTDVDGGSTIHCGEPILSISKEMYNCYDVGSNPVTLTIEDSFGRTSECATSVWVQFGPASIIIYVNEDTPSNNGWVTWATAFADLQDAISLAVSCNFPTEIWVAKGTYHPGTMRIDAFMMWNDMALYGGFDGNETAQAERDWETNETILNGDIGTLNDSTDNSFHVILNDGNGLNSTAVLDGFIIADGNADGVGDHEKGAGMYCKSASPTIQHCHFKNNQAAFIGGAVYFKNSLSKLDSCTFTGNSAVIGGAVSNSTDAATRFAHCSFLENAATINGGGIFNNTTLLCGIVNCYFEDNTAGDNDGAIANLDSSPDIINSAFLGNAADEGAGISNRAGSSPLILNCSFHGNEASSTGGAIRNHTGTVPLITNSIIWGNGTEVVNSVPGPIVAYSIVQQASGTYPGVANLNVDPLFADTNDLRLLPCSPAIDVGLNTANGTLADLLVNTRKVDATGTGTATIDLGPYEFQSDLTPPNVFNGLGNGTDWDDPINWSDGFIPQYCRDVLIPSAFNVTIPNAVTGMGKTLEVELGAILMTDPNGEVDIGN